MNTVKTSRERNTIPSHTSRAGKIRVAVWEHHGENGVAHKIMVNRLFQQGDKWQRGRTFFASELPAIVQAVNSARQWIDHRRQELRMPPSSAPTT
jgi:hypothetical protein